MDDAQIPTGNSKFHYDELVKQIQQIFDEDDSSSKPLPIDVAVALDNALRKLRLWASDVDDEDGGLLVVGTKHLVGEVLAVFKHFGEMVDLLM
jgi:hypothetical protein